MPSRSTTLSPLHCRLLVVLSAVVALLWSAFALAQSDELTATVDRQTVSIDETLTLRVRYTGQTRSGQPDFSLLEEHFDIINRQQSNQISTINGVVSAFTEWTLTIAPKRKGKLLIPSFKYNGNFSDAIEITVTEAAAHPDQLKNVFVETDVSQEEIYVQQQLILTYRLYTTRSIDSMDAEPLSIDGVRIEELPQTRYQRRINGVNYGVLEVPYALIPQQSQDFTIPRLRWTLRVVTAPTQRGFGFGSGRYEIKRLTTQREDVQVKPIPSSYPSDATWLPAQKVELSEEWSDSPSEFRVGEPLTRTITLRAQGLTAAQLPPLPIDQSNNVFKLYPDQPSQETLTDATGVTGIRKETMAVVPTKAGEATLPAITVDWWDTSTNRQRTATLPERTVFVEGGKGTTQAPTATPQTPENQSVPAPQPDAGETLSAAGTTESNALFWQLLSTVLAILCLILLGLWWRARQRSRIPLDSSGNNSAGQAQSVAPEKQAFKALQQPAVQADLPRLRQALLHWGSSRWPDNRPRSLHELAARLGDNGIAEQLNALDAALFGGKPGAVDGKTLVDAIGEWRKHRSNSGRNAGKTSLKPLY
jgi:hypothetical protein